MKTSFTTPAIWTAPPLEAGPARRARFAGLDGLRALAVTAVIVFHLFPLALPGGFVGVDVFFVISGFLITSLLLREHDAAGGISLGGFWLRRARRLIPAIVVLLLVCCSAALVIGGNVLVGLWPQVVGAATFSSNWIAIAQGVSYIDALTPQLLRNLWSLGVEEQFYILWPLVVVALLALPQRWWRVGAATVLAVASALAMASMALPDTDAPRAYFGTDSHSFGLAAGAALALAITGARTSLGRIERALLPIAGTLAFGAVVWLMASLDATAVSTYRGGLALVAALSLVMIAGAISPGSALGQFLDLAPFRWVGERSYGLYLWHWPVLVLVTTAAPEWSLTPGGLAMTAAVVIALTVGAAMASYTFIETPIRRRGFREFFSSFGATLARPVRAVVAVSVGAALVAAVGASAAAMVSAPAVSDAAALIDAGQRAVDEAAATPTPTASPTPAAEAPLETAVPEPPAGDRITAIGDSVMLAAAPQLQAQFPGIAINAKVSRQMREAPGIVQQLLDAGVLRDTVIVGLGTNGPIDRDTIEQLIDTLGPDRELVLVNAQAPRGWIDGVNTTLSTVSRRYREVELANWHDAIAPHIDVLARDHVHPGPTGGQIYSTAIAEALTRLAALPPARDTLDVRGVDQPV